MNLTGRFDVIDCDGQGVGTRQSGRPISSSVASAPRRIIGGRVLWIFIVIVGRVSPEFSE